MTLRYVLGRLGAFVLIVWAAATLNFAMPRLASVDPVREQMLTATTGGGANAQRIEEVIESTEFRAIYEIVDDADFTDLPRPFDDGPPGASLTK